MTMMGTRGMLAALAAAVLLLGGLAGGLVRSQARERTAIEREFERRATLAASLTSSALHGTAVQYRTIFGGAPGGLDVALRRAQGSQPDTVAAILDATGNPLARWPAGASVTRLVATPTVRQALAGRFAISNLMPTTGQPRTVELMIAAPFQARGGGRRVAIEVLDAGFISAFATAYLTSAPAIRGGQAYLIDANGRVISSSQGACPERRSPTRRWAPHCGGARQAGTEATATSPSRASPGPRGERCFRHPAARCSHRCRARRSAAPGCCTRPSSRRCSR